MWTLLSRYIIIHTSVWDCKCAFHDLWCFRLSIVYEYCMKLQNILHEPIHYKIGVTCVYNGREINALVITRQSNPSIFKCNEFTSVWSMLSIFKCNEFTSVWSMLSIFKCNEFTSVWSMLSIFEFSRPCYEFTSVWSMLSIFKFSRPCYEFTSVWSMFACITYIHLSCLVRAAVMRYTFLEDFLISNSNSVESCSDTQNPFHFKCNENTLV